MHPFSGSQNTRLARPFFLACLLALVAGCGSVSGLGKEAAGAPMRIADYPRVEVLDFSASHPMSFPDAKKQADYDASLAQARKAFADHIAEAIIASGAFAEVARAPGPAPALRISGDITRYDEGNIVARGVTGFAGQTHFDAVVIISDASSGKELTRLTVDRNSWPLPVGASLSTLQTTNFFMKQAAKKVADELAAKKNSN